ncbi:MAG TPA: hypothetical protein VG934_00865 [Candidatus Paceibacterota bacterium]|nr:hypothetical protein [Candidatus Paceibacterota bacterium]
MDQVHFLNLEYLLLRAYDIFYAILAWLGISIPADGASSTIANGGEAAHTGIFSNVGALFTSTTGVIALIGMTVAVALVVLAIWVRVRLLVVEHEGYHGHEAHEHAQIEAHAAEAVPKNAQWDRVFVLAASGNESDWRRAILEADIMLGDMLKSLGYRGDSVGERLRDANPLQFTTLDLAWKAHKVRNDIAHGGEGYHLSQREANATIDLYRRVFEEFHYI